MSENLKRLEELTNKLPRLDFSTMGSGPVVMYGTSCLGFRLWNDEGLAVQRCFMPAGSRIEPHHHAEVEILVIVSGQVVVGYENGDEVVLDPSDCLKIPPQVVHSAKSITDTWVVGITIPASEGYP